MRIAVVGMGNVGRALARRFAAAGHEVVVGSRDPGRARAIADALRASSGASYGEAVAGADAVLLAVPWWALEETLVELGDLDDVVLIDAVNPFTDDSYTTLVDLPGSSAAEVIQRAKPRARVVKGWNTVHAQVVDSSPDFGGVPASVFVCGDDAAARDVVAGLARAIGYGPVDCGPLSSARFLEPMAGLKVRLSYELGQGVEQAINLLER